MLKTNLIDHVIDEFTIHCNLRGLNENTIKQYQKCWLKFILTTDIDDLSEITSVTVKQYTHHLISSELSKHTVNNYLHHLRTVLNWMVDGDQEFIKPIKVKMVKAETEVKYVYTDKQMLQVLKRPSKTEYFVT